MRIMRVLGRPLGPMDGPFRWIANHLPVRLVYWCGVRILAHAVTGEYDSITGTTARTDPAMIPTTVALNRWYKDRIKLGSCLSRRVV